MKIIFSIAAGLLLAMSCGVMAQDTQPAAVTLAGSLQDELGCPGDWQPECTVTHLTKNGSEWSVTFLIPAGTWEYKIALNNNWTESYGYNLSSNNAVFTLAEDRLVTFTYQQDTHVVSDNANEGNGIPLDPQPDSVTIAGDLQISLGCSDNWNVGCSESQLTFSEQNNLWVGEFNLPVGEWNFKAAINGSWTENYGRNATAGGDNIGFSTDTPSSVKFFYSHASHWITNNKISVIATAVGDFQTALGCAGNWRPECLRSWLQDTDGNGLYTFSTTAIPVGQYQAKVALNEAWDESFGNNGSNIDFAVTEENQRVFFTYDASSHQVFVGDEVNAGDLSKAKAYWLNRNTLAWNLPVAVAETANVQLHYSVDGGLTSSPSGVAGGQSITLTYQSVGLSDEIKAKFRHLAALPAFTISDADLAKIPSMLKSQLAISATQSNGGLIDATGLQIPGVLDDLYFYEGSLGVSFKGEIPNLALWAPTAQSVELHLYDDGHPATSATIVDMIEDPLTGVWRVEGDASWNRKFYRYAVNVFVRHTGQVETNLTTDPYTISASTDGKRSQIVNLADSDLQPENWNSMVKPALAAPEDIVLYELHLRDFSIGDTTVAENLRGTFMAFTEDESNGMQHLRKLSDAGLTHIHLLPIFDCATILEDKGQQQTVAQDLSVYASDGNEQQAAVNAIRGSDGFNWCYDPHHYNLPEGSYATDAEGVTRIREFRTMVQALNESGLRVVMDVVFNHTSGSLLGDKSVLDKVVPGYYHRLNNQGDIEQSTCCANTATEHAMMEKLMLDSLHMWAVDYKVDGFRFDIMGHHSKDNIVKAQQQLQALTLADDGVDGSKIYLYGEGWNFGEVTNNARFTQASIDNMANTGVGTFNNRIRDAVRGGGPFDAGIDHVKTQSFINGLYLDPNAENSGSADELEQLLERSDQLRVVLAGSLANYSLIDRAGNMLMGSQVDYDGQQAGYTADPQETINYIEAHDNETLFDSIQYKAPLSTSPAERVRMQNMGASLLMFSQGIPFVHAGQELLRSKSMDRNSYDSGDWFNVLDYTYQDNGWARGLPLSQDNQQNWSVVQPLLANPALVVSATDIARAQDHMLELLKIRKESALFRLQTAAQVQEHLAFFNTGANQIPGVIAMSLTDSSANLDENYEQIMVVFNTNISAKTLSLASRIGSEFSLHPLQQTSTDDRVKTASFDNVTGAFTVPARTTAVFVTTKLPITVTDPEPTPDPTPTPPKKKGGGFVDLLALLGLLLIARYRNIQQR